MTPALDALADEPFDGRAKGFPLDGRFETTRAVRASRPSVFDDGFVTPFAVLHREAVKGNIEKMARFCAERDVLLAPHAKTTMAPQLFAEQIAGGAWGMTVATPWQLQLCRRFGVQRLLLANQLVDPAAAAWLAGESEDDDFKFLSYVDSNMQVERMAKVLQGAELKRPLDVLLEVGMPGGRTGCRRTADIEATAAAVGRSEQHRLVGVSGFEGLIGRDGKAETLATIRRFLRRLRGVAERLVELDAIDGSSPILLSAGGSGFFDIVVEELSGPMPNGREVEVILRSGCYVSHEAGPYGRATPFSRKAALARTIGSLDPAIEVWTRVLSRPEPTLALLDAGKRDLPVDTGMPEPLRVRRPELMQAAPANWRVTGTNDQHSYLKIADRDQLAPGDLVSLSISHPCTFFDKWTWIPLVDGDYRVVDVIRTFF